MPPHTPTESRDQLDRRRMLALFRSPVGLAAARIYDAVGELYRALNDLVTTYPDREALVAAGEQAYRDAGLDLPEEWSQAGPDRFSALADESRGWFFFADMMLQLLQNCAPPDDGAA